MWISTVISASLRIENLQIGDLRGVGAVPIRVGRAALHRARSRGLDAVEHPVRKTLRVGDPVPLIGVVHEPDIAVDLLRPGRTGSEARHRSDGSDAQSEERNRDESLHVFPFREV